MDARDVAILRALLEHKILTTSQLSILFFRSLRRCQQRLKDLTDLGLLGSFDPRRGFAAGRLPDHQFLTELGASVLAHRDGVPRGHLPWVPDESYADNRNLRHRMGVNAFFCALVEASRATDGHCLHRWAPERKVRTRAGEIQPDGFGRYLHPAGACQFYLEYDRGTEGPAALTRKLRSYLRFAGGWGEKASFPNLLVVVPISSREENVEEGLVAAGRGSGRKADVPLFIASERLLASLGVLGAVWRPPGEGDERLRLTELPAVDASLFDRTRCLGRAWTDPGARSRISPLSAAPRFPTGHPREP
ncbi:MAG TPA: replication-relaxation family protein [Actinomycetota bacterium]